MPRLNIGGDDNQKPTDTKTQTPSIESIAGEIVPSTPTNLPAVSAPPPNVPELQGATTDKLPVSIDDIAKMGSEAQTQIANVTSRITSVAKTSEIDEMGELLTSTIMAAKGYDPNNLFKGGLFGFFKAKGTQIRMKFDNVDQTVERLVKEVDVKIAHFRQRVVDLDAMGIANEQYHRDLKPQMERCIAIADWMEANQPPVDPNDAMSGQKVQNWNAVAAYARKRSGDLHAARVLAEQQAAQIDQMKLNSSALAQKFGDIKVTTIPILKTTFTLYIINLEQKKGAEMTDMIDETTQKALMKNAQTLGQNTVQIHTSLNRANISMEALQANYEAVVKSLDETKRLQNEMKQRVAADTPKLEQLSRDLSTRLAQR
jgi:uncharacterized protein YaaN involved in tellurite resistance